MRILLCCFLGLAAIGCTAAGSPSAAVPVTLSFENAPNPPTTGSNTMTVVVTDINGRPVDDATVTGELFMPVMESMGKTAVPFDHQTAGRYTGQGKLSMGGSWQVAVTAQRSGKVVATRTFNITTKS